MKKILMLFLIFLIVGCSNAKIYNDNKGCVSVGKSCDSTLADMSGYVGFNDLNHFFLPRSMSDINSFFDADEDFIVYYGYKDCPWCKEAVPVLNDLAKEYDYKILYVNVKEDDKDLRDRSKKAYLDTLKHLDNYLAADHSGKKGMYVPAVYFVVDGEVVDYNIGTVATHNANERVMNDEEKSELINIYRSAFEKIVK
ncbi:MAG: TlpA family protein disulfide reductase [Anaerorhabdus sp.]